MSYNNKQRKRDTLYANTAYPKITQRGHNSKYHHFSFTTSLYHIQIEKSRDILKFAPRLSKERVHFFYANQGKIV